VLRHAVVLQHVQEGRLSGVIQTQEQEFAGFLPQAQVDKGIAEPIPEKHFVLKASTQLLEIKL